MKPPMILAAGLSFLALCVFEANARIRYSHQAKRHLGHVAPTPRYPPREGWYVHDPEKLPFGSSRWWEEMVREGRARRGN
jgi:hypothetical protein